MTVPDSVSYSALASLLAADNKPPASPVIPTLEFGDDNGAPCSLQLAVMCLIQQSRSGVNLCQLITASLFLLYNAQSGFRKWERLAAAGEGPFAEDPEQERQAAALAMRELSAAIDGVAPALEDINRALLVPLISRRMAELGISAPLTQEQQGEQLSHLLIDDELLNDLGLERSTITRFLSSHF